MRSLSLDHYTYRVTWSPEDGEHVGLCIEFPSLSWLAETPEEALAGVRQVVSEVVSDLEASGEPVPEPLAEKGKWCLTPFDPDRPELHSIESLRS